MTGIRAGDKREQMEGGREEKKVMGGVGKQNRERRERGLDGGRRFFGRLNPE